MKFTHVKHISNKPKKLKVGSKIKIRPDLSEDDNSIVGVVDRMLHYAGKTARITEIINDIDFRNNEYTYYVIDIDQGVYNWEESMFVR